MSYDVVFFPDYRSANPYQAMLYEHAASGLVVGPGSIEQAAAALRQGGGRPVVFHLHWEDAVHRNQPDEASAWTAAQDFLSALERFVGAGGRVLWTLHNAAPHDGRYAAVHRALVEALPRLVDIVHVHGHTAAAVARERLGIAPERIAIVPHGNYLPRLRPLSGDRSLCRESLGLPEDARIVLLFGRLGAYKGGAELIEAVAADPALRLVIAGKQVDPLDHQLAALPAPARARIHLREGFLPEDELPLLFHAVDAVAAPYRAVLSSGTAMLALSLGRPVIAPSHPSLTEVLTDGVDAILHEPAELRAALTRFGGLETRELKAMQAAAGVTAARYDWRSLGLLLDGLFHRLRALRRPYRCLPEPVSARAPAEPAASSPSGRAAEG